MTTGYEIAAAMAAAGFLDAVPDYIKGEHSAEMPNFWGITETLNDGEIIGFDVIFRGRMVQFRRTLTEAISALVEVASQPTWADDEAAFRAECGLSPMRFDERGRQKTGKRQ